MSARNRIATLPSLGIFLVLPVLIAGAAGNRAHGQCVSDGLELAPCCTPATPVLPTFPAITDKTSFICFRDCEDQFGISLCFDIDAPVPVTVGTDVCGLYIIKYTVRFCGGGMEALYKGTVRAQYVRNWQEVNPAGDTVGVWRFLLNGDMRPTPYFLGLPITANPSYLPPCSSSFGDKFYVAGFIDYAFDCTTSTWSAAWAVNHECDAIHHATGTSRPAPVGGFHPRRSYTFAGPATTFFPDPLTTRTADGTTTKGQTRWNDWSSLPAICTGEENLTTSAFEVVGALCPCDPPGLALQYDETEVVIAGACGSTGTTAASPPVTPFLQKRIGTWINPTVYPGVKELALTMGDLDYEIGCIGIPATEFFEGVTMLGGWAPFDYGGSPLGRQSVDIGSSNRTPTSALRRVGKPHVTNTVVSLNFDT